MTKADLVVEVVRKTGLSKKDAAKAVNALFESLKEAFLREERVEIRGFGIFATKNRKPRVGRNPKTLEEVRIPARKVVVFKLSKILRKNLGK
jgi:DNA-binding protein HU-beta